MRRTLLALTCLVLTVPAHAADAARHAAAPAPPSVTASTFLVSGRGWGHGVGLSQYGALGYANEGWTYDQIIAHFYPGTELGPAPVARVRVLLAESKPSLTITSRSPFRVRDVFGTIYPLAAGSVPLGPKLRVTVNGAPTDLPGPVVFLPGTTPLELGGVVPGPDRGRGHGQEVERDQHRRRRAVPRRRRAEGDAERLARRGAARRRRSRRVRTHSPTGPPARGSTSMPTCAARSTAASPARPPRDGGGRGDGGRGRALRGQGDHCVLPLDVGRAHRRRLRGVRRAGALPRLGRRSLELPVAVQPLGADAADGGACSARGSACAARCSGLKLTRAPSGRVASREGDDRRRRHGRERHGSSPRARGCARPG